MNLPDRTHRIIPDENLNWADFIDALAHQDSRRHVLVSEPIQGRRLRDAYLDKVTRDQVVHPLASEA